MLNLRKDYFNHSILPIFGGLGVGTGNEKSCKDASMQHAIKRIDTSLIPLRRVNVFLVFAGYIDASLQKKHRRSRYLLS